MVRRGRKLSLNYNFIKKHVCHYFLITHLFLYVTSRDASGTSTIPIISGLLSIGMLLNNSLYSIAPNFLLPVKVCISSIILHEILLWSANKMLSINFTLLQIDNSISGLLNWRLKSHLWHFRAWNYAPFGTLWHFG